MSGRRTRHERRLEQMRRRRPAPPEISDEQRLVARRANIAGLAWIGLGLLALADYALGFSTVWPRWADEVVVIAAFGIAVVLLSRAAKLRRRPRG
jgi:hypothetical protein